LNDVFVSCTAEDAAWAGQLAPRLVEHGLSPCSAEWSIEPGDVVNLRPQDALRSSANGIATSRGGCDGCSSSVSASSGPAGTVRCPLR
jgi:TIR domain-containing protein